MKRMKRIAALALAVALCLSLSGCRWLDEMKDVHGKWQEDGTIVMDGHVYKPIQLPTDDLNTYGRYDLGYVTQPDVPVLLSETVGKMAYIYCDGILLEGYFDQYDSDENLVDYYPDYEFGPQVFCREDYYDSVVSRIQNGFVIGVYAYTYLDEYDFEMVEYVLSAEETTAVDEVLRYEEPILETEDMDLAYGTGLWITLEGYSTDRLFYSPICSVTKFKGVYYLCYEDADYNSYYCEVPVEKYPIFDKIVKAYLESLSEEELADLNLSISA